MLFSCNVEKLGDEARKAQCWKTSCLSCDADISDKCIIVLDFLESHDCQVNLEEGTAMICDWKCLMADYCHAIWIVQCSYHLESYHHPPLTTDLVHLDDILVPRLTFADDTSIA